MLGVLIGLAIAASLYAVVRLLSGPHRVISPERQAMQAALHEAMATLPHLRKGLSPESALAAAPHLRPVEVALSSAAQGLRPRVRRQLSLDMRLRWVDE